MLFKITWKDKRNKKQKGVVAARNRTEAINYLNAIPGNKLEKVVKIERITNP